MDGNSNPLIGGSIFGAQAYGPVTAAPEKTRIVEAQEKKKEAKDSAIMAIFILVAAGAWFTFFTLLGRRDGNPMGLIIGSIGGGAIGIMSLIWAGNSIYCAREYQKLKKEAMLTALNSDESFFSHKS